MSKLDPVLPIYQQYLDIKARYPEPVLFFRLGDFYETFGKDAEIAARVLDLVLTSRPISRKERVAMAGVPHQAIDQYVAKLIGKGYHVAVCDQKTAPSGSGLVEREVSRVISPPEQSEPDDGSSLARIWGTDVQRGLFGDHLPMPLKQLRLF